MKVVIMIHRFVIPVNCSASKNRVDGEQLPDKELIYNDNGFIILSDQYTEKGNPTRLVIICHGAGLAVISPAWMKFVYKQDINRFAQFAVRVRGCDMNFASAKALAILLRLAQKKPKQFIYQRYNKSYWRN